MDNVFKKRGRPKKEGLPKVDGTVPETSTTVTTMVTSVAPPVAEPTVERPSMRPQLREDPRERAARRAAEIREHLGGMDDGIDEFHAPPAPPGWSYEWKRKTLLNMEDPSYQVALAHKGWEPVEASRHPEMMPAGSKDAHITRKGMILMERPLELTEEARAIEQRRARMQVKAKEEQLAAAPAGTFERTNKDAPMAKVKKGYEAMPIPEK